MTEHLWGITLILKVVDDNSDDNPADIERYATVSNHRLRATDFLQTSTLRHNTTRSGRCSSRTSNPQVAGSSPAGRAYKHPPNKYDKRRCAARAWGLYNTSLTLIWRTDLQSLSLPHSFCPAAPALPEGRPLPAGCHRSQSAFVEAYSTSPCSSPSMRQPRLLHHAPGGRVDRHRLRHHAHYA